MIFRFFFLIAATYPGFVFASERPVFDHDYESYQKLLAKYVHRGESGQTRVDYAGLKKNRGDLTKVLGRLSHVSKKQYSRWSKKQKLAFLINAYNGFTLEWILKHYPIGSIKDTGVFIFGLPIDSPWKKEFIPLLEELVSLDTIEHDWIRAQFDEPRIHFAVNCASIGCPSLAPKPFVSSALSSQLQAAAVQFLQNPKKNRVDLDTKTVYLSKIFKWYQGDFGDSKSELLQRLLAIVPKDSSFGQALNKLGVSAEVKYLDYDWGLNDKAPSPPED